VVVRGHSCFVVPLLSRHLATVVLKAAALASNH